MGYTLGRDSWLNAFDADAEIESLFTTQADVLRMLAYEVALARAQASVGLIPSAAAVAIAAAVDRFEPDFAALSARFAVDGVAAPALVGQLRAMCEPEHAEYLHFGSTSQDLTDSSLMLALRDSVRVVSDRLEQVDSALAWHARTSGDTALYARTRMQRALPITVAEKVNGWRARMATCLASRPPKFPLQLGGPEGESRAVGDKYQAVAGHMAAALGLSAPARHWQTDRSPLLSVARWFTDVGSAGGKFAQDVLLMAQDEVAEVRVEGGGRSSAMPHKANPVLAEVLLAKTRHCQLLLHGLESAAVHENERSGQCWTLEWMLLPRLVVSSANAVSGATTLAARLEFHRISA